MPSPPAARTGTTAILPLPAGGPRPRGQRDDDRRGRPDQRRRAVRLPRGRRRPGPDRGAHGHHLRHGRQRGGGRTAPTSRSSSRPRTAAARTRSATWTRTTSRLSAAPDRRRHPPVCTAPRINRERGVPRSGLTSRPSSSRTMFLPEPAARKPDRPSTDDRPPFRPHGTLLLMHRTAVQDNDVASRMRGGGLQYTDDLAAVTAADTNGQDVAAPL